MEKDHPAAIGKNEVRVTTKTRIASYLRYVYHTLEKDDEHFQTVVLKAAGRAIARLVPLVELIKRRIVGLHQDSKISSTMVMDKTRSGEDVERKIVTLEIILSKEPLDKTAYGYQQPLPETEVEEYVVFTPGTAPPHQKEGFEIREEQPARGRGRGIRAGFRGLRAGFRGGF
mmetsp:Transcript_12224/g.13953  ORF Transcript_12224/g.13953 Transcript_12224/m.13953 type:complete len:172 (+) Transcript_12224:21-536(+)